MDIRSHCSYRSVDEIKKTTRTLSDNFDIHWFRYTKVLKDNSRTFLSNSISDLEYFFEDENYQYDLVDGCQFDHYKPGIYTWDALAECTNSTKKYHNQRIGNDIKSLFKFCYGVVVTIKDNSACEIYEFSSEKRNLYFYDHSIFFRFICYFKEKHRHRITEANNELYQFSDDQLKSPISNIITPEAHKFMSFQFDTKVNRYYLGGHYSDTYLTKRELVCVYWAGLGKSNDDIAKLMEVSPRTVDKYLEAVRKKLNCYNKMRICQIVNNYIPYLKNPSFLEYIIGVSGL